MKRIYLSLILSLITIAVHATTTFYSKSTGFLNNTASWGQFADASGAAPADFTSPGQIFIISNNTTPTINGDWTVSGTGSKIQVGDGSGFPSVNFTIPAGMTVSGPGGISVMSACTLTIQGTTAPVFGTIDANATIVYGGTGSQTIAAGTYTNLSISGTRTGGSTITLASGTISVTKTCTVTATGASYVTTGNTFSYTNSSGGFTVQSGIPYNNLTMTNTGTNTNSANGNITVNGTLTTSTGIFDLGAYAISGTPTSVSLSGTITTTTTVNPALPAGLDWSGPGSTATIKFASTTGGQYIPGGTYKTLTCFNTSGTNTVTGGDLSVTGVLTTAGAGGTLDMGTNAIAAAATLTNTNATLMTQNTSGAPLPSAKTITGTVIYNATTGGQTIVPETSYNGLTLSNTSGTDTAAGDIKVNALTINSGSTLDFKAAYKLVAGASFSATGNSGIIKTSVPTSVSPTPIPSGKVWGGKVIYSSDTGSQTVMAGTYNDLQLSNTSGTSTASNNIVVNDSVITTAGGTLDMSTRTLSGSFAVNNNGTISTKASGVGLPSGLVWGGTVNFYAAASLQAGTYNNLSLTQTTGAVTAQGDIAVNGALTTTNGGTLAMGTFQMTGSPTSITHNGTLTTSCNASPAFPAGDWSGTGGTSAVTFTSTTGGQYIPGGTYKSLKCSHLSGTNTATGNITTTGVFSITPTSSTGTGILDMGTYTMNAPGIFMAKLTSVYTQNSSSTALPSDFRWANVVYNGTGAQTIVPGTYTNLSISGARTGSPTIAFANDTISVKGNFTIPATGIGSIDPGTSTFVYDSAFNGTIAGTNYYTLIFGNSNNTKTADNNVTVGNQLVTTSGGTFSLDTFQLNGTLSNMINNGTIKTNSTHNPAIPAGLDWSGTTGKVTFGALTGRQYIPTGTYGNLVCSNTSDTNFVVGNLTITNQITTVPLGTGALNMGTFPLAAPLVNSASKGTLITQNSSATPLPKGTVWKGPVVYNGTGDQTIVYGTYTSDVYLAGNRTGTPTITLDTNTINFQTNLFATYTGSVNFATTASHVKYSSPDTSVIAPIAYGFLYISGGYKTLIGNIEIRDSLTTSLGTFNLDTYQFTGTLSQVRNGGTIKTLNTANPPIPANADWTLASGTIEFGNPTGGQFIPAGTYSSIHLSNTSGIDMAVGTITIDTNTFTVVDTVLLDTTYISNTPTITIDSGSTLDMGSNVIFSSPTAAVYTSGTGTVKTANTSTLPFPQAVTWMPTVEYNNATGGQTIVAGNYEGGLTNSNTSGVNFIEPDSSVYVKGNLTLTAGSTLSDTGRVIYLAGNIAGTGTAIGTGKISMITDTSGAATETIGSASLTNVQINNTGGVLLNGNPTINGTLTFTNGIVDVANNDLTLGTSATVGGTPGSSSLVVTPGTGHLVKMFATTGSFSYPVGDSSNYSPVALNFTGGSFGMNADAAVRVVHAKHPSNANASNYLNRYWSITTSNITSPVYNVDATYADGDVVGSESSISAAEFITTTPWIRLTAANAAANTLDVTGLTDTHFDLSGISSGSPVISVTPALPIICSGNSVTLDASGTTADDTSLTYTWTPSTGLSATTGSVVNATLSTGATSTTMTYTLTVTDGNGFSSTMPVVVTVNPAVAAVTGASNICGNATVMLSDASTGGTWSSADTTLATVNSASGLVTGVAGNGGNATISYTLPTGCYATTVVTVLTTPTQISGSTGLCSSTSTTLGNTISGGTWTSTDMAVATIGSSDGFLDALTLGTTTISYVLSTGCYATQVVTVLSTPTPITGNTTVCDNGTTTLSNAVTGGTWTSSSTSNATIGSLSGIVSGVLVGNTTITYTLSAGCFATYDMTVLPAPAVITGTATLCENATTTLSDADGTGTWSSANTSTAIIGSGDGVVTGIAANTTTISYTVANGCAAVQVVTVLATPTAITGNALLCTGTASTLSNSVAGGTWSSTNGTVATVGSGSGLVSGLAIGNSTISYVLATGCYATRDVTVVATPSAITGTPTVCEASTTALANSTLGGTWSSSNTATATVGSSDGVVTGVANGVVNITYTVGSGCFVTQQVTVLTTPAIITGTPIVCTGQTTMLANSVSGGTWSSTSGSTATIGSSDGIVTGVASGVTTISYILSSGCYATQDVTVSTMPAAITGTATVCENQTTALSDAVTGGTWTSSSTSLATVGSGTGIVTGVLAGNPDITYTLPGGCFVTQTLTVNQSPSAITGNTSVCLSSITTLSNSVSGGTWSSSDDAIATVGSGDGVVNGISAGNITISYTLADGCFVTQVETVYPTPAAITGSNAVCVSATITLSNAVTDGTWSSSNAGVASVGSATGVVTGVGTGNATITYTLPGSCGTATKTVSVGLAPNAGSISGATSVVVGSTITLTDGVSGGVWSTSNANATVGSTGIVTGVTAGVVTISYTVTAGCGSSSATKTITVNGAVSGITGTLSVCLGSSTTLTDATPGGSWSSPGHPSIIYLIPSTGVVTGVSANTTTISYGMPGNYATAIFTVNPLPSPITGSNSVCLGSSTTLSSSTPGGTWMSDNITNLTIDPSTGVATGNAVGSANVTYTLPTGCIRTYTMTVKPLPSAIVGITSLCIGATATFTDPTTGGVSWTSSNSAVASVGSLSGVVSALTAGTATISYNVVSGCSATTVVTVNATVTPITGSLSVCAGFTTALGNATSGGTWSTTSSTIATIGSGTGIATGITIGTTTVTYSIGSGCKATAVLTVNNSPSVINGSAAICAGTTTALSSSPAGGTWSSSNTSVATVGSTGIVTGVTGGTSTISYTIAGGCSRTIVVTVNSAPVINGSLAICVGSSTTLTSPTSGGTWSSSNLTVATIGASTGVLAGIAVGTSHITYALSATCRATVVATVSTGTASITGPSAVCQGATITLSSTTPGGTWSSSNTARATVVMGTGDVTGVSTGSVYITYSLGTGCFATKLITVGSALGGITGNSGLCIGASTTYLSSSPSVGIGWSSSNTAVASVGALSGVVTGTGSGTATITYTPYSFSVYAGCVATKVVSVDAAPAVPAITGPSSVQVGHTITLSDAVPGGVWSSNLPARATVTSTGVVTGIAVPAATISYTVTNGACQFSVTKLITVTAARPGIEPAEGAELTIFPNPNSGTFTVKAAIGGTFTVYSLEGKQIQQSTITEGENRITLPKDLAAGIYMCRFTGDDESSVMVRLVYENQ